MRDLIRRTHARLTADAVLIVGESDYVSPLPRYDGPGLLDDPQRLRAAWDRMRARDAEIAAMSDERRDEVLRLAAALINQTAPSTPHVQEPDLGN